MVESWSWNLLIWFILFSGTNDICHKENIPWYQLKQGDKWSRHEPNPKNGTKNSWSVAWSKSVPADLQTLEWEKTLIVGHWVLRWFVLQHCYSNSWLIHVIFHDFWGVKIIKLNSLMKCQYGNSNFL